MPTDLNDVTQVELLWIKKRVENRIRFCHIIHQIILDGRRRRVSFAPGSIFAFVRWASNEYGTVVSRIHILRAVAPGERYSTVPFVQPGGEILLNLVRWDLRTHGTGPEDHRTQVASLGFDASVWEIWGCLASGATLHLPAEEARLAVLTNGDASGG